MGPRREIEARLVEAMSAMDVIDAHEHIMWESERLKADVDALTLFCHYTPTDLISAGMEEEWARGKLQDSSIPLAERWEHFEPYYESIRHGSYARAAQIAARDIYGVGEISAATCAELSDRMKAENTPGIYDRILRKKCRIRKILAQGGQDHGDDLFAPNLAVELLGLHANRERIDQIAAGWGATVKTWDDLLGMIDTALAQWRDRGGRGVKTSADMYGEVDGSAARSAFGRIMSEGDVDGSERRAFVHAVIDAVCARAGEADLVVACHTGIIWNNWNDFHVMYPGKVIPLLQRHRGTRFDLYHAGLPWVRVTGVIGKSFPNASLNLCWCHIMSQRMSVSALDEWIDMVPTSKIIGFGGDYSLPIEKVWGHLVMAREDIARALAGRVADGLMDEDEAAGLAEDFLYANPKRIYGIDC